MPRVRSFDPICGKRPRLLILGSMPGVASLAAQQYYAHPRNAFWPIMQALFDIDAGQPYRKRVAALSTRGVALWDVLASCERKGSLDAAIERDSIRPNDLPGLLSRQPSIVAICFNGQMAETAFRRHVLEHLPEQQAAITLSRLPSTSPANASWSFERKLEAWRAIQHYL